jgi:diguanylate cyclase (GGDEF)-like protein
MTENRQPQQALETSLTEEELRTLAFYDRVTGLPNRTLFVDRVEQALNLAQRQSDAIALMFIDLDHFKAVNDTLGHQAGDELLKQVAERMHGVLRATDTIARLGGDEFVVLIPSLKEAHQVKSIAEKLVEALSEPYHLSTGVGIIGASIGITVTPPAYDKTQKSCHVLTLLEQADQAMYLAKQAGRGQVKLFNAELNEQIQQRQYFEQAVWQALEQEKFALQFQPVFWLPKQEVDGIEVSWRETLPALKSKPLAEVLSLIDNVALCEQLGKRLIEETFKTLKKSLALGVGKKIAFNVSSALLQNPSFPLWLQERMEDYEIEPEWVILELDESNFSAQRFDVLERIQSLSRLGVGITLDNVGEGAFPLTVLRSKAVDNLKLSASLVQGILYDESTLRLVQGLLQLSQALNKPVVADGVASQLEASMLQELGCKLMQGPYFSGAFSEEEMERTLIQELDGNLSWAWFEALERQARDDESFEVE